MKKALIVISIFILFLPAFSEKVAVIPDLVNPELVESDNERLYILDGVTVFAYSLKDYKLLYKVGKRGEGPGELLTAPSAPLYMQLLKDEILVNSYNKMIYYSKKDGKIVKERKIPFFVFQLLQFGENFAVTRFNRDQKGVGMIAVFLMDNNFKELKKLYENTLPNDAGQRKIAFPMRDTYTQRNSDKLFVFDMQNDFHIDIFDLKGNKLKPIEKEYEKFKVTDAYKKERMEILEIQKVPEPIRKSFYFTEYMPVMRHFAVKNDNIYVRTYKTKGDLSEFFMLDMSGKTLKHSYLPHAGEDALRPTPAATYTFKGTTYYYLVENTEEEEWELHAMEMK